MNIPERRETQYSVTEWGEQTFGPAKDPGVLVERARVELDEVMEAVRSGDAGAVAHEIADVVILLYRVATIFGCEIDATVTEKMQINRQRQWVCKGDGTGSHVKGSEG